MPQNNKISKQDPTSWKNQMPDLSLHISLPNSAPSSICTTGNNNNNEEADSSSFDIWRSNHTEVEQEVVKSHSESPIRDQTHLSLLNHHHIPTCTGGGSEAESPWRSRRLLNDIVLDGEEEDGGRFWVSQHHLGLNNNSRSIRGIVPPHHQQFQYNPTLHQQQFHNPYPNYYSSNPPPPSSISRFNGIRMESLMIRAPHHQYHHQQQPNNNHHQFHQHYLNLHHQFGLSNSDFSNGFMGRSNNNKMLPSRIHHLSNNKRNMRAPRMRWTSSLHARFVHAVQLLGGHESSFLISLYCFVLFSFM